ncbi:hypothetical protein D3C74_271370 [compost metagenome]
MFSCCTYVNRNNPRFPFGYYYRRCIPGECPPVWQGYQLYDEYHYPVPDCNSCPDYNGPVPPRPPYNGISEMKNNYNVFKPGYEPYYGPDVPRIPSYMKSKYGWKLRVDQHGRKFWAAMNKSEIRNELSKYLGVNPSTIDIEKYLFCNCDTLDCDTNLRCLRIGGPDCQWCECRA